MRRLILLVVGLALVGQAWAGSMMVFNEDISVTATNTATVFTDNGSGGLAATFNARYVLIRSLSSSANTCAFDLKDTTAVYATDTKLEPGGSISWPFPETSMDVIEDGIPGMGSICDTAQTATFRVTAYR